MNGLRTDAGGRTPEPGQAGEAPVQQRPEVSLVTDRLDRSCIGGHDRARDDRAVLIASWMIRSVRRPFVLRSAILDFCQFLMRSLAGDRSGVTGTPGADAITPSPA